jgi:hypothetical protein
VIQDGLVQLDIGLDAINIAEEALRGIPNGAKKAISAAINETLPKMRGSANKGIQDGLNIIKSDINDHINITNRSNATDLSGVVEIDYAAASLRQFKAKSTKGGVVATTVKAQGPQTYKHYFIPLPGNPVYGRTYTSPKRQMTSGRYAGAVIKRGPRKGQPILRQGIEKKYGPAPVTAFQMTPELSDKVMNDSAEAFQKAVERKIEWQLATGSAASPDGV